MTLNELMASLADPLDGDHAIQVVIGSPNSVIEVERVDVRNGVIILVCGETIAEIVEA